MSDVAIIGAGAWGTALALQAHRAGARVTLVARDPAVAARRASPRLPGVTLPEPIAIATACPPAALTVLAVPMQALRAALPDRKALLLCAKGLEATTLALPTEIAPGAAVLSGPNFAAEIAAGLPAAAVVAARDAALAEAAIAAFATKHFRLYASDDPIGVEVGGAAKNVVAIAAGAVIGAGLGENARAALVTRGLAEMSRLAVALGGRTETLAGLSGLGDLLLTTTGAASRNFSLGLALGRGAPPPAALAEGAATAPALVARANRLGVEMPIAAAVADLLAGRTDIAAATESLLGRPRRTE